MGTDAPAMCWSGSWEQCVREVTLSADPETVGTLAGGWQNLSTALGHLRDKLVGRAFVGPVAPGTQRPHSGGLPDLLASWKGSGGDAYREHLNELGTEIEQLITHAANVSGALDRIEGDIRKAVASIPIPVLDDFGWDEWSLPNGTNLDNADDGANSGSFLRMLRADYTSNPSSYADGAFRDKADELEATLKLDGSNDGTSRGGVWDTQSHLDNWYRDNQAAANSGARPLPTAVETERPKLVVPPPKGQEGIDTEREDPGGVDETDPGGTDPGGYQPGSPGGMPGSTMPSMGSPTGTSSYTPPPGPFDSYSPSEEEFDTELAGVGDPGSYRPGGLGPGGLGPGGLGGTPGGLGGSGGLGGGVGAVPGLLGGGNGKVPPMTSAGSALRGAMAAAGHGQGGQGMRPGGMGMMGGMMGGGGLGAHGGQGEAHTSWLTEDDDPWGANEGAPPGILR